MLSNWFAQPQGSAHSSVDEGRGSGEIDEDTQVVEPDQGNGRFSPVLAQDAFLKPVATCAQLAYCSRMSWLMNHVCCVTVLSHIISQLRPGADLSRVVLPTFILEPRSMLERITKYVSLTISA